MKNPIFVVYYVVEDSVDTGVTYAGKDKERAKEIAETVGPLPRTSYLVKMFDNIMASEYYKDFWKDGCSRWERNCGLIMEDLT